MNFINWEQEFWRLEGIGDLLTRHGGNIIIFYMGLFQLFFIILLKYWPIIYQN